VAENTKAIWRERLARFSRTNLSIEEFAVREGVAVSSLRWWRWRLGSEAKKTRAYAPLARAAGVSGPAFVEVGSPSTSASSYEVVLANGRVVRVPASFDDAVLARIISVVEGGG
jgi:transposase